MNFRKDQIEDVLKALDQAQEAEEENIEILSSIGSGTVKDEIKKCNDRLARYRRVRFWLNAVMEEALQVE